MSRAFKTIDNQFTTSSDYTEALRRKTMYKSIMKKAQSMEGAASIAEYNNDINIEWCDETSPTKGKLKSTINYETLLDIAKGKRLANPVLNGNISSKFNIFTGNFTMIHSEVPIPILMPFVWDQETNLPIYDASGVAITNTITFPNNGQSTNPMDASWNEAQYPGWWFDPYGVLTELNCLQTKATNLERRYESQSKLTYRWSNAYWKSVSGESMSGFSFPESVTFAKEPTDFSDPFTRVYAPLPSYNAFREDLLSSDDQSDENKRNARERSQLEQWCQQ